ncbi:hypothetical protein [Massilia sp. BSC265]|uniref:hypothetical protein n=1 Tax=Massilia sp. BSC265 TaxID=1549812 RepID=UPI0004E8EA5F|nr:hypothetical protein [Massilia sp. BSC265]KFI05222.1 hypothetical protein JN27_22440 [Massilia sp. BSC265]
MNPSRLLFPVVLALPLSLPLAAAEPVRITTQMSGQLDANPFLLQQMGVIDFDAYPEGPLPFSLTIDTVVDPDDTQDWCGENWCYSLPAEVSYSFTVDGRTIGFTDSNDSTLFAWSSNGYLHGISYRTVDLPEPVGYFVSVDAWVNGPEGSFGEDPFAPKLLGGEMITGRVNISMLPLDPDIPVTWSDRGQADSVSVQVSVVPEPTGAGMLAAGLIALVAAYRRRAPSLRYWPG